MTSDAAKCIVIFWCLYAFIASGFEHSVANMTLFGIALPCPASADRDARRAWDGTSCG